MDAGRNGAFARALIRGRPEKPAFLGQRFKEA